jgi:short-subunit dehydrogenase
LDKKVAVISGAARGIGRALSTQFADAGYQLVLLDRDLDGLASVARSLEHITSVRTIGIDFADPESITDVASQMMKTVPEVHILVNNAGVALHGRVDQCELQAVETVIDINLLGPIRFTLQVLPLVKAATDSVIVNMSSVFGLVAPAGQAAYAASKFGLRGFSEALGHELSANGVRVLTVYPAGTRTDIARHAAAGSGMTDEARAIQENLFEQVARLDPEEVARKVMLAIASRKTRLVVGRDGRLADITQRLFPENYGKLAGYIAGFVVKRRGIGHKRRR